MFLRPLSLQTSNSHGRQSKALESSKINKQSSCLFPRKTILKSLQPCRMDQHPSYPIAPLISVHVRYQSLDHTTLKISNARAVKQSSTLSSPWPFPEFFWRLIPPWGGAPRQLWARNRGSIRSPFGSVPANSTRDYCQWDKWLLLLNYDPPLGKAALFLSMG